MASGTPAKTFASLLRTSQFIKKGDFRNSIVNGTIFHVVNDDLYVDVGLKFHAVIKKPQQDHTLYVRGANVKLRLLRYEITDRFLGQDTDTSLLEADAILLGLDSTPIGSKASKKTTTLRQPKKSRVPELKRSDKDIDAESIGDAKVQSEESAANSENKKEIK